MGAEANPAARPDPAPAAPPQPPADRREVEEHAEAFARLRAEVARRIVGQERVVDELLIAILTEAHCLIVGVPGLAKTLMVSTIAELLSLRFKRIQFTPDLMPSDITGATIIAQEGESRDRGYQFLKGPIFANVVLADEINRTPPKTQAALMEAMEERQVTAGGRRLPLERPFFVLATQNPIEQEGTYGLPVSQTDRFLFNVIIDYPSAGEEFEILERTTSGYRSELAPILDREAILRAITAARRVAISDRFIDYATRIVRRSRPTDASCPDFVRELLSWGGGPRAVQSIILSAKAHALLAGRPAVEAEDVHRVVIPALRHRIILSYHAEAEGMEPDEIVTRILASMPDGLFRAPAQPRRSRGLLSRLFKR
jgi:MoxR-like ATPase